MEWASNNMVYAHPGEIEDAVSLSEYDSMSADGLLTGIRILAITKHRRDKLYIFIFSHKTTWLCDETADIIQNKVVDEQYELIASV